MLGYFLCPAAKASMNDLVFPVNQFGSFTAGSYDYKSTPGKVETSEIAKSMLHCSSSLRDQK
jgi:hypothetical protein